ncbi:glycosyltransferase family 4 protein [Candidatus Poribacteria bacterium]|nr:glycosyltransferase family 4 protein [Candidatus Poribacteria bacterium]
MAKRIPPYKILYINPWSSADGGTSTSLLDFLRGLNRKQFIPYVMLPSQGPLYGEVKRFDTPIFLFESAPLTKENAMKFLGQIPTMMALFQKHGIQLVHVNGSNCRRSYAFAAYLLKIPLVAHIRNACTAETIRYNFRFRLASKIIANSNATAAPFREDEKCKTKVQVIYNGVDLERFETTETVRGEFGISPDGFVVGIVGRVCKGKGTKTFIEMIPHVIRHVPHTRFLIVGCDAVGEEGYTQELKQYARQLNVAQHIIFTGFRRDVPQIMNSLDVLVHASLAEAFGKVVIEAMASGKCVVATNVGGIPEIIYDKSLGTLVDPEVPEMFANAVITYLKDENLRIQTGMRARQSVRERFDLRGAVMKQIESVYLELLEQKTKR